MAVATRMRREIGQSPQAVDRIMDAAAVEIPAVADAIAHHAPDWVMLIARGTSDHAATYARYLIETHLGLPTALAAPSVVTIYDRPLRWRGGLLIGISQSGRSDDLVAVMARARAEGALTVAITNQPTSPLARAAAWTLPCHAGRELAVPATKTYVTELAVVAALVAALRPESALAGSLPRVGEALRDALTAGAAWLADGRVAATFARADHALVVSRGFNLATAHELALKFKETCAIFAEGYSSADFAHGPLVLAGPGVPVLVIRPDGPMGVSIDDRIALAAARGAEVVVIGGAEVASRPNALALPLDLPEALTPLVYIVPGQLLVEAVARQRGMQPDAPAGLTKVTRTR